MIKEKKEAIALTNKIEALKMKILKPRKIYSLKSQRKDQVKKNAEPIRDILFSQLNLGNHRQQVKTLKESFELDSEDNEDKPFLPDERSNTETMQLIYKSGAFSQRNVF